MGYNFTKMRSPSFPTSLHQAKRWVWYVSFALILNAAAIQFPTAFFLFPWVRYKIGGCFAIGPTILWVVVPLIFLWNRIELTDISFRRWRKPDWVLFAVATLICCAVVFVIPLFPVLTRYYVTTTRKLVPSQFLPCSLLWVLSWLPGWELLHRFILLRSAVHLWPKWGWTLVPVFETAYHLQKPLPETAGMAVFSTVMTYWSWKRRNLLLPLLVHFLIELTLIGYLLWVA